MTIRERLLELREEFFNFVGFSFQKLAGIFGFPDNPGMLLTPLKRYYWNPKSLAENLIENEFNKSDQNNSLIPCCIVRPSIIGRFAHTFLMIYSYLLSNDLFIRFYLERAICRMGR